MRWTKSWGTVSGGAELHMLNHAERTRRRIENAKKQDHLSAARDRRKTACR